jgi:hypothetical protein
MDLHDLRAGLLVWFRYKDEKQLLCRVRFMSRDYVSVQVVAATAEQVIESGYGVGEAINVAALALQPAKAS